MDDEDRREFWLASKSRIKGLLGTIEEMKEELKSCNEDLKAEYKVLQQKIGMTKDHVLYALALEEDESGAMLEEHKMRVTIAQWENHPIGTQMNLFEASVALAPQTKQAAHA